MYNKILNYMIIQQNVNINVVLEDFVKKKNVIVNRILQVNIVKQILQSFFKYKKNIKK